MTDAALRAMARAVDLKDLATNRHSLRVSRLAQRLAEAAGWSPGDAYRLCQAGMVHDAGKLGLPQEVLCKSGRLTEAEYELVKRHPGLGAEMLVGHDLDDEQLEWVRHHHERPDGRGYPDGLVDGTISDGAALLAIADTFDVMVSGRVYQAAMPVRVAVAECRSLCGVQFRHMAVRALEDYAERRGYADDRG